MVPGVPQLAMAVAVVIPAGAPVRVACPVHAVTRIVLPEPLHQLKMARGARRALGVVVERTRPRGVLRVEPGGRAGAALVELRGPRLHLRLSLETIAEGRGGEVRLARDGTAGAVATPADAPASAQAGAAAPATPGGRADALAPRPDAGPSPPPSPAAPPLDGEARVASAPAAGAPGDGPVSAALHPPATAPTPAPPPPAVVFDVGNLMRARPVTIGRREGLPGQRPMVLVDALRGDTHLWLRFTLQDGATARVRGVSWEAGPIETYTQEPVGRDLRVVVQLPRAEVTRKTRVALVTESGAEYRFALSGGRLADLWRKLFE